MWFFFKTFESLSDWNVVSSNSSVSTICTYLLNKFLIYSIHSLFIVFKNERKRAESSLLEILKIKNNFFLTKMTDLYSTSIDSSRSNVRATLSSALMKQNVPIKIPLKYVFYTLLGKVSWLIFLSCSEGPLFCNFRNRKSYKIWDL